MRSVIIIALLCLFGFSTVGICDEEQLPPEWTFDDDDEIKNWGAPNQLTPLELDDVKDKKGNVRTVVKMKSAGGDPFIFPDGNWQGFIADIEPFDGGTYDTIYLGVKVNQTGTWQIYYITEDDTEYTERQRQNFQVAKTDDFQDLEFKMETGGWKDEVITGFRLDPGTVAGIETQLDYLSFRGIPGDASSEAVEYTGKLAITWGAIKQ